jgi:carbamoyltransferase
MIILGIKSAGPDTSATLIKDGKIVAASGEDRFNREKHTSKFPEYAINFCLKNAYIEISDVDEVAIGMQWNKRAKSRFIYTLRTGGIYSIRKSIRLANEDFSRTRSAKNFFRKKSNYKGKIRFFDHYDCHAAAVYFASPYKSAAILSVDGAGEKSCTRIYKASETKINNLFEVNFPNSIGSFYSLITKFLGFRIDWDEGKTMALAAYGAPAFYNKFDDIVRKDNKSVYKINVDYFDFFRGKENYYSPLFINSFGSERKPKML